MNKVFFLCLVLAVALNIASAFMPSSASMDMTTKSTTAVRSNTVMMACRFNAKQNKRRRNAENMKKFRMKPTGPARFGVAPKTRKRMNKDVYGRKLDQEENDFAAKIFQVADLDSYTVTETD